MVQVHYIFFLLYYSIIYQTRFLDELKRYIVMNLSSMVEHHAVNVGVIGSNPIGSVCGV